MRVTFYRFETGEQFDASGSSPNVTSPKPVLDGNTFKDLITSKTIEFVSWWGESPFHVDQFHIHFTDGSLITVGNDTSSAKLTFVPKRNS
jgi:hypothetical protein